MMNNTLIQNYSSLPDMSTIYNFITDYPSKTFWFFVASFIFLLLYIYIPRIFDLKDTQFNTLFDVGFLGASFLLLGLGISLMIPIHFEMTPERINIINKTIYVLLVVFALPVLYKLYKYRKGKERVQ